MCAKDPEWRGMAHNAQFERAIEAYIMGPRYDWPMIPVERDRCTMAMAYAMALPASLENAAAALGVEVRKDMEGRALMMKMAKPRRITSATDKTYVKDKALVGDRNIATLLPDGRVCLWWGEPENRDRLYKYCLQDTEVERVIEKRLMALIPSEQEFWALDQEINNRGIRVDIPAIHAAMAVVEKEKERLDEKMRLVTDGAVTACSQATRLLKWANEQGVDLDSVAKGDVLDALALEGVPAKVKEALLLRQECARSSTAKLKAMLHGASDDGRVRGTAQYHGASTGRQAGRRLQPQNFVRPTLLKKNDINALMEFLHDAG